MFIFQIKIETIRKEREEAAESLLRTQFKIESIIYTQDSTYSQMLGKRKREEEASYTGRNNSNVNNDDKKATLKEMVKHLKSYYQVSVIYMLSFHN